MAERDNASREHSSDSATELPGATLARARVEAGLSQDDVAAGLNCLRSQIEALENDDYEAFKSRVYITGYLRAYAKLLDIDGQPLVDAFQAQVPREPEQPAERPQLRRPVLDHSISKHHWGVAAALAIVLLLWWDQERRQEAEPYTPVVADTVVESTHNPLSELRAAREQAQTPTLAATPSSEAAQGPASVAVTEPQPEAELVAPDDELRLSFGADCWVEIKDRSGEMLVAGMKHAGDTLHITGEGPFEVLVGFAPAVEGIFYNGEPVEIDRVAANNSARLVVGES